jgi:D-alanyl-D-alanine carboxypeptidase
MNSNFIMKLALTTAFVAVPTIACTSLGISNTMKASPADASAKKAHKWARKAEKALAKGNIEKATMYGEMAVEADMENREYRAQLSQIYMSQGRFQSAESTLMDVMELGQADPRTVISLALSRIAQGKVESAVALVDANRSIIPASDYGLTLALAGKTQEAVDVLGQAIRDDNATARTRQNLALAYALNGNWRQARVMAVQDMPQDRVNERITEWAQYARPGAYQTRVAGLLNVSPQEDAGQPVRLALANSPSRLAAASAASAASAPQEPIMPEVAVSSAEQLPAIDQMPAAMEPVSMPSETNVASVAPAPAIIFMPAAQIDAPLIKAPEGPAKAAMTAPAKAAPAKLAIANIAPKASGNRNVGGTHLVQLGAYANSASAKSAWEKLTNRHSVMTGFSSASSTVKVNGKTFVRLAASGFNSFASADAFCKRIKSGGGECLVRKLNAPAPVRLASR